MNKALFLDRDGTIIVDNGYAHKPEDIQLIPGAANALRRAHELGYLLFLFTNQSGVGRGMFTLEDVHRCNAHMLELLGLGDELFVDICIAPEHPENDPPRYRKPSPRYILEMIDRHGLDPTQCAMVGDRTSDWGAGVNAGIRPVALRTGKDLSDKAQAFIAEHQIAVFDDLAAFVATLG
ncbi:HAD-IIIA family hydrolase [Ruficoccus amylovorans]|uniref:D,D-heptose 1,7-bisphosphate phosphatase n=1 Tax=Ruficoccus amylovorans TaxID=1804625 RepID=A0A842HD29_9BACT|nr:HAD-IIIA family hydrolase [Ruficoccus amylovorans]MBC2593968.1 HAD-IIIA family hydrolase [Ruficoccus amylovorans]